MPRVSVLLPVYNREKLIPSSIESVQQQTFTDWELIILDDGSTDRTLEVCRSYESSDKRIRVLSNEKNLGVAESRKRLLSYATAEYIAIQDSDDISTPERFQWEVEVLDQKPEIGLVSGIAAFLDDQDNISQHWPEILYRGKQYPQEKKGMVRILYSRCNIVNSGCMFRRILLEQIREPYGSYKLGEDWYFFVQVAHLVRVWGIPKVVVKMRRGSNHNHLWKIDLSLVKEELRMKQDLYNQYKDDPESPVNYWLYRKSVGFVLIRLGRYVGGWRGYFHVMRAVARDPLNQYAWQSLWILSGRAVRKAKRLAFK
jgi:glycosyltransferase involved in cell wall biosynthesis